MSETGGYPPLRCVNCGILIDTIDEAIEAGWIPYFHEGDPPRETSCRECSETLLQVDENGEMEVRDEYRGKIKYLDGRETEGVPGTEWVLRVMIVERDGGGGLRVQNAFEALGAAWSAGEMP